MTLLKWEEATRNSETVQGNGTSTVGEIRCDPDFMELWKVDEWKEEGDFQKYVRTSGEKYFAFVKFCVPVVTGVNKWKNDLKSTIWNYDKHTLKSCGMLTEAEEGFAVLIVENGWERWDKEARWRCEKGIAYDASTKLKQPNDEFGAYRWSDGGGVDDTDGRGRHDWSHSGLQRYKDIMTKVKESDCQYDFDQRHERQIDQESEEKSLLVRFREGDVKWTKVHIKNGRDNHLLANGIRVHPPEDKASKRHRRDQFLDTNFVTKWEEV